MGEQNSNLADLKQAIGGDGDYSLVTQIRLFKMEAKDQNDLLIREFRDFAAQMADNNSKALIEALKEVIRDFNAKISEQFGDNFKELNRAVGALLQWQENYRQQIEALVSQFELALTGIEKSRLAIENISQNTAPIPQAMENLRVLLEALEQENKKAHELLEGFAALRTQADEVFPVIKESMNNLVQNLSGIVISYTEEIQSVVTEQTESVENLAQSLSENVLSSTETIKSAIEDQDKSVRSLVKHITEQIINTDDIMRKGIAEARGMFSKTLNDMESSTKKRFEEIDKQWEDEFGRVAKSLGSKITSIMKKVLDDYAEIIDKQRSLNALASQKNEDKIP
jgi:phage-related protein